MRTIWTPSFSTDGARTYTKGNSNDCLYTYEHILTVCDISHESRKNHTPHMYRNYNDIYHGDSLCCTKKIIRSSGLFLYSISSLYFFPVYNTPKVFQILCSGIAIVDIVCMFPNITSKKWSNRAVRKRSFSI